MIFSEAATRGVLWKKQFLKISQYSQESCRPQLKNRLQHRRFFPEYCEIFKNTYFEKHLLTAAFHFLKQSCFKKIATLSLIVNQKKKKKEKKIKIFSQTFTRNFSWISFSCVIYRTLTGHAQIG